MNADQRERIEALIDELPDENEELARIIKAHKLSYLQRTGVRKAGAEVFEKNCATCHQVAGVGNKFAPNLDGIGNRGLDRIIEDIMAPNRNLDIAFRATTVITRDGQVYTGLARPSEAKQLVLVDGNGMEKSIPLTLIRQKIPTKLSPMPANFADVLNEEQFRDLLAYLLSLRSL